MFLNAIKRKLLGIAFNVPLHVRGGLQKLSEIWKKLEKL